VNANEIKQSTTEDLECEYFNLRGFLPFEYMRAFLPTVIFGVIFYLRSWIPQSHDQPVNQFFSTVWPILATLTAFVCASVIVYFGGRAWHSTRIAVAIYRELQHRHQR